MNGDTAEWLISKVQDFDEGCEVMIRMSDGHILSYFYNTDKHTYHRGLRDIFVDREKHLLIAESDYGLSGQADIADFIDLDNVAMISIIQSEPDSAPPTL